MNIPENILVKSDNNILKLKETIKQTEGIIYVYTYVKSVEKLGMEVSFTEKELLKNLSNTFKEIV